MKHAFILLIIIQVASSGTSQTINRDSMLLREEDVDLQPYALVAGGSKGIGYAIAEALAKRKYNLVLIARHLDSLELNYSMLIL